jgi:glycosyltransferase involved in cell wall biosynthesis
VPKSGNPLVSAIIPTHNRADLLPRSLESVINQSYSPIEIIVVDDASTDNTEQIVREYPEKYDIHYLKNENACRAAAARNRGIEAARGAFIAGLDDDDEWHKDRIRELLKAYSDDFAFVTSDVTMIYPRGRFVWKKRKIIRLKTLLLTNQVGNQVLVKRDRLLEAGGFDTTLDAVEDYDLWVRLCARYGPVRNVQQSLQKIYTDHPGERITERSFTGFLQFYQKHKTRMTRAQRKYQLYRLRRLKNKGVSLLDIPVWVPPALYGKEIKRWISDNWLAGS